MSLEKRIEALENNIRSIIENAEGIDHALARLQLLIQSAMDDTSNDIKSTHKTGKGWSLKGEGAVEIKSNDFVPRMASPVEEHLNALTALIGPSFKVENGELFIKNVFIEEASIQHAKYNLELLISRSVQAILKDAEAVELAIKKAAQNQAADLKDIAEKIQTLNEAFNEYETSVRGNL